MRMIAVAFALLMSISAASAQATLTFRGESFVRKHEALNERGGLVEFVPPDQTLENWTQLVAYRAFFDSKQTIPQAAATVGRLAAQRYPGAKPRLLTEGNEAMVDFVLVAPNGMIEFNVFKYAPGPRGSGVVSLQYARRFRGVDPDDVRVLCAQWVNEVANFEMNAVRKSVLPRPQAAIALAKPAAT